MEEEEAMVEARDIAMTETGMVTSTATDSETDTEAGTLATND